jgi:hypothetical protein
LLEVPEAGVADPGAGVVCAEAPVHAAVSRRMRRIPRAVLRDPGTDPFIHTLELYSERSEHCDVGW